ncbi:MAG: secondary thiamine-phosphate synthase enzyme YjbQ [Rhodanobacter sp.]
MNEAQSRIEVSTPGRGFVDITEAVAGRVAGTSVDCGIVHVFVPHTSCSLVLGENADPAVRDDLERWFARAVVDGDPLFRHTAEGPDDMPAHIRSILAGVSVTVPLQDGRLQLGTWQGIYLWEHRLQPHRRAVMVTVLGALRSAT